MSHLSYHLTEAPVISMAPTWLSPPGKSEKNGIVFVRLDRCDGLTFFGIDYGVQHGYQGRSISAKHLIRCFPPKPQFKNSFEWTHKMTPARVAKCQQEGKRGGVNGK